MSDSRHQAVVASPMRMGLKLFVDDTEMGQKVLWSAWVGETLVFLTWA